MMFSAIESLEPRKLRAVDLSVASVEFPIGVLTPNEFTQVAVTVRNSGTTGQITPFSGRVYLSANATLDDGDIQVGSFTLSSLPSKTTAGVLVDMALKGRVPKGTYFGLVMIDTGLQVAESDETNNVAASFMASMTVLGAGAQPLQILGGDDPDVIRISQTGALITVDKNGTKTGYLAGDISAFSIETGGSNDQVYVDTAVVTPMFIHGGAGHDTIGGGSGHDTIRGAVGNDRIAGGIGNDWLYGDAGNDRLVGEAGADRIFGADGNDFLDGGSSNDRLMAGSGIDNLLGGNGDDYLHTIDGETDTLDGGIGLDTADEDPQDVLTSVEV
jgi:Ca2+-binding RTX toxin-like protein